MIKIIIKREGEKEQTERHGSKTNENSDDPLAQTEGFSMEGDTSELDDQYLEDNGDNKDTHEDGVGEERIENVQFCGKFCECYEGERGGKRKKEEKKKRKEKEKKKEKKKPPLHFRELISLKIWANTNELKM